MKKFLITVMAFLGVTAFDKSEDGKFVLTDEQKEKIKSQIGDDFLSKVEDALSEMSSEESSDNSEQITIAALKVKLAYAEKSLSEMLKSNTSLSSDVKTKETEIIGLKDQIRILSDSAENPKAGGKTIIDNVTTQSEQMKVNFDDKEYLGGIKAPYNKIDASRPYNMRAYAAMQQRAGVMIEVPKASSMDYTSLSADLGDYYRVRKQDAIISWIKELPTLEKIFPLESGLQDEAILVNMWLEGEFSQADNSNSSFDSVVKGGYKFEPEKVKNASVMFAHRFTALKELETKWIGYLNKEGSNSIKISFIEYILKETSTKLHNERELRRINGKRVNPVLNQPGSMLSASDGIRQYLKSKIANLQINPFSDLTEWNNTNICDYIKTGTSRIPQVIRDTGKVRCYLSEDAKRAHDENFRARFGSNTDYKGMIEHVLDYPNIPLQIVPNLSPSKMIFWSIEGNIILTEHVPNEMYDFSLEQQDWSLKVWSQWKEGVNAYMVGKKMASSLDFPEDYSSQMIWVNNIDLSATTFVNMDKDDASPSVAAHKSIQNVLNSASVAITAIDDANVGDEIRIKCTTSTNGITIAKSGVFSLISAAWNPSKGDTITLKKRSDGKFIELSRTTASSSAIAFSADDTSPSVAGGSEFITVANTQATAITTLDDAVEGKVYKLYGGSATNSSTIANSGNFVLTAAFTASVGAWIRLQKASDGKFYEIDRNA